MSVIIYKTNPEKCGFFSLSLCLEVFSSGISTEMP